MFETIAEIVVDAIQNVEENLFEENLFTESPLSTFDMNSDLDINSYHPASYFAEPVAPYSYGKTLPPPDYDPDPDNFYVYLTFALGFVTIGTIAALWAMREL